MTVESFVSFVPHPFLLNFLLGPTHGPHLRNFPKINVPVVACCWMANLIFRHNLLLLPNSEHVGHWEPCLGNGIALMEAYFQDYICLPLQSIWRGSVGEGFSTLPPSVNNRIIWMKCTPGTVAREAHCWPTSTAGVPFSHPALVRPFQPPVSFSPVPHSVAS